MKLDLTMMLNNIHQHYPEVTEENCEQLNEAYSNYAYRVQTKDGDIMYKQYMKSKEDEDDLEIKIQESIGFPVILHKKDNYRIEVFYENEQINLKKDSLEIAKALRKLHDTECVGVVKTQSDFFRDMLKQNEELNNNCIIFNLINQFEDILKKDQLRLCHNDLQRGNILKIANKEIKFIDFEYSCLGSIYFDIANFFCEVMSNYLINSKLDRRLGFTDEEKKSFLRTYFNANTDEFVDLELKKVNEIEGYCHLLWFIWASNNINKGPSENFDYAEHAESRLQLIKELGLIADIQPFIDIVKILKNKGKISK